MPNRLNLVGLAAAAVMIASVFAAVACGEWVDVPNVRQQSGSRVLDEIQAKLPQGTPQESNWISRGHYGAHYLNSYVRNHLSPHGGFSTGNAAYVYGGRAFVFPNPPVRISEAMQRSGHPMPGWDARMAATWDNSSGYVADELSAYIMGTIAGIQYGWDSNHTLRGSFDRAVHCWYVLRAVAEIARERGYSYADDLDDFVAQSLDYLRQLESMVK